MHVIWNSNGAEKNKYKNIACKIILYMHEMFSTSLKKNPKNTQTQFRSFRISNAKTCEPFTKFNIALSINKK